ncbi:glycosyltransferase family 2 protein [Pseudomarimonas salicorniae]|uniref:Glycosyltransferase n=1 Tax=Pseudomarimonas salicorniae TaxID=2933270 RepID=A0ABT0GDS0_9GAMM|nr:glycosyltransferase [Lysobacter sp. CAU 1642]MCK7592304.1 glycosyltransferase [Lysobacter sp. CAU 1642]
MSALDWLLATEHFLLSLQWFFIAYLGLVNGGYLLLNLLSIPTLARYMAGHSLDRLPHQRGFEPPVSLLVPAYNEEKTIVASVRSLLQLEYPRYEVIVVNDGSKDDTMGELIREFGLVEFPAAAWAGLPSQPIRRFMRSLRYPQLRVLDKENGGKADALNAGINAARFPLFCAMDADSVLDPRALLKVVQPFIDDPLTIASGGTVRLANGCTVSGGVLERVGLPRSWLARFQVIEYLRAFLFGRLGWSPMNAVLIISGAFGLFRRTAVIDAGGYRTDTVGEDMELVVRLHRLNRIHRRPYRITYVPDPICWTEAPETTAVLRRQRSRWQRGLAESLAANPGLLFHLRGGFAGWLAFPFFVLFELLGPLVEVVGYASLLIGGVLGLLSPEAFWTFLLLALSFGILLSVSALMLEEMSFRLFPRGAQLARLVMIAILENFGYRQMVAWWRLRGLLSWLFRTRRRWGEMTRVASWRREGS